MKKSKNNKGITLITLAITIIVILILAGISVATLFGENGLFKSALTAKEKTEIASYQEIINLSTTYAHTNNKETNPEEILKKIKEELQKEEKFKEAKITGPDKNEEEQKLIIVTKEGYVFYVYEENNKYIGKKEEIGETELNIEIKEGHIKYTYKPSEWTNQDVEVGIEITKEEYKQYQIEYTYTPKENNSWKEYKKGEIIEKENGRTIYARLTNGISATKIYVAGTITNIDKKEPEIIETTATTNKITIKATDEASGIIGYAVTENTEKPTEFTSCSNTKDLNIDVENKKQGTTYYTWVKDEAGNISNYKETTTEKVEGLTTANTTFTYKVNGAEIDENTWTNQNVTVEVSTTIQGYTIQTSKDGTNWRSITSQEFTSNGTIYARVIDETNQSATTYASANVTNIDKTPPEQSGISISSGTLGLNNWYTSNVEVRITAGNDSDSKVNRVTYSLSGATTKAETSITSEDSITISEEGTTTITSYTYDNAGNRSEIETLPIKKDTVAPTITLSQANTSTREYSKLINVNISDSVSQVSIKKYAYGSRAASYFVSSGSIVGTSFTAKTSDAEAHTRPHSSPGCVWTVYAKDNAGNETIKDITVSNLLILNNITAKNGLGIGNGATCNSITGAITLPTGSSAVQFGPYWELPGGTYEITYRGTNLPTYIDQYTYLCYVNNGESYSPTLVSVSSNQMVYRVTTSSNAGKLEFVLYNYTSSVITINDITIKQL